MRLFLKIANAPLLVAQVFQPAVSQVFNLQTVQKPSALNKSERVGGRDNRTRKAWRGRGEMRTIRRLESLRYGRLESLRYSRLESLRYGIGVTRDDLTHSLTKPAILITI